MPDAATAQALMMPISITLFFATFVAWTLLAPFGPFAVDGVLLCAIAGICALCQALIALRVRAVEMPRRLMIETLIVPPIVLSALPLAASAALGHTSSTRVVLSLFSALAGGGNAFLALMVSMQVPRDATIRLTDDGFEWRSGGGASANPSL
jgi:hypothetical protein